MEIRLLYGKSYKKIDIDDRRIISILRNRVHIHKADREETDIVMEVLENPVDSDKLCDIALTAKKVLVITSDHTRPVPSKITLPLLLKEIKKKNSDVEIKILIATGCHRATNRNEMIEKFGQYIVDNYEVINHDCDDEGVFKGILPSGGELWVNRLVDWAELIIAEGFIEPHFFAGFSGGRKSILPGIASRKTVLANHCAEFIASPYAKTGNLENNPIHKDMIYALEKVKLRFILNVVIDENKRIVNAFAGNPITAHEMGCEFVKKIAGVKAVKSDIVITSNGGYPLDQNIYQSVKGMTAAEACVKKGGVIIMVASCTDGHGGDAFYNWFKEAESVQEVINKINGIPRNGTKPDQWQAQILARVLSKCKVIMVTDYGQRKVVENMFMSYAETIDKALDLAEKMVGKDATITVIPDGVGVIVYDN